MAVLRLVTALVGLSTSTEPGTGVFEPWIEELWAKEGHPHAWSADAPLELRVTKGLGTKGYNAVRVSVIANQLIDAPDFNFTYKQQFKHRWTENYLHSKLVYLAPGSSTYSIAGQKVTFDLPAEDSGIRAVFVSDPCFSSKWIHCAYADRFQTFHHTTALLNAIFADASMNMFSILGDNFYDQSGELSKTWWGQLSPEVKRRFQLVVNGNHDNWVCGGPGCGDSHDNFGQGQMQYYPSDTVASTMPGLDDANFLDFSVDPDAQKAWTTWMNKAENFVVYHKLGNVGFLSFSGAAAFSDSKPHFQQACKYFQTSKPAVVFLLGHWNSAGMGCAGDMDTPDVRRELLALPECSFMGEKLKYMDGHKHCNYVQAKDSEAFGFMIGANGMSDSCEAQNGFLFLDSTGGRVKLQYFEVASQSKGDRFQQILDCVQHGGLAKCASLAETWLDVPATPLGSSQDNESVAVVV